MARKRRLIDCIFCGDLGVPQSTEDVLPLWLAKKLAYQAEQFHPGEQSRYVDSSYASFSDMQIDDIEGARATSQRPTGKWPAGYKAPSVCQACNGGWMSRLESAVALVLTGLLTGQSKGLAPYDQLVLATWAIKTSLTYDAARDPRYVPNDVGTRRMFGLGHPLPGVSVRLAHDPRHVPMGEFVHARQPIVIAGTEDLVAVRFGFQFDCCLLFTTIGLDDSLPVVPVPHESPYSRLIWPPAGVRFDWPRSVSADEESPSSAADT